MLTKFLCSMIASKQSERRKCHKFKIKEKNIKNQQKIKHKKKLFSISWNGSEREVTSACHFQFEILFSAVPLWLRATDGYCAWNVCVNIILAIALPFRGIVCCTAQVNHLPALFIQFFTFICTYLLFYPSYCSVFVLWFVLLFRPLFTVLVSRV